MSIINRIQKKVALAPFTTYLLGGTADYFVRVRNNQELVEALCYALKLDIPYFLLGSGANILIGDYGFRGLVIKNEVKNFSIESWNVGEHQLPVVWLRAGSGAIIGEIIDHTIKRGYSGLEHYAGIPSTVGGALWQNLHFLSPDRLETVFIKEIFHHAYLFNLVTQHETIFFKEQFEFGYDTSLLHKRNHIVLEAVFQLQPENSEVLQERKENNLAWRTAKHPPLATELSCGSVFKKIQGIGAGRLIEQSGLKGFSIGGAKVSEQHANFITHRGFAKAKDVKMLIEHVIRVVFEKTGHTLETEIQLIGEF